MKKFDDATRLCVGSILAMTLNVLIMVIAIGCAHYDSSKSLKPVLFEDCIKQDLAYMDKYYGSNYRWYESSALLKTYLDEGSDGEIEDMMNVFMVRSDPGNSYDTNILMIHHDVTGTGYFHLKSKWVEEDVFIEPYLVRYTFKDSLVKAQSVKPMLHTKHVVLRKQLGPNNSNPQYIYGNNHGLLFIDADTGTISHDSPAFQNTGFVTWLGEWPQ